MKIEKGKGLPSEEGRGLHEGLFYFLTLNTIHPTLSGCYW